MSITIRPDREGKPSRIVREGPTGEIVWDATPLQTSDEFVELKIEDGVIKAWSWSGYLYKLDYKDGRVLQIEFVK